MKNTDVKNSTLSTPLNVNVNNSADHSLTEQVFSNQKLVDPSSSSIRGQRYLVPSLMEDRHSSKDRNHL